MAELSRGERFSLLCQGDAAQITGHDPQAQPPFHPVFPVIGAFTPPEIPSQARNAALDARTPAIAALEASRALDSLAFLRELACRRDGHPLDPGFLQVL